MCPNRDLKIPKKNESDKDQIDAKKVFFVFESIMSLI